VRSQRGFEAFSSGLRHPLDESSHDRFFASEVAVDERHIHPCAFGDAVGRHAAESDLVQELFGGDEDGFGADVCTPLTGNHSALGTIARRHQAGTYVSSPPSKSKS